jgi:hypothetical protein
MVKEGGATIYMAAMELGIAYSTAKHIIKRYNIAIAAKRKSSKTLREISRERLIVEIVEEEAVAPAHLPAHQARNTDRTDARDQNPFLCPVPPSPCFLLSFSMPPNVWYPTFFPPWF